MRAMPPAIASATGSLTAPWAAINERRHAEQIGLRLIAVDDNAAVDVIGAAGHFGEPRHHEPARARLGGGNRQPARAQQLADDLLHRLAARAEQIAAERRAHICHRSVERAVALFGSWSDGGQMQLDLAERCENRRR